LRGRLLECFRLLELPPDASIEQVRIAYRSLSRVWHPDRFAGCEDLIARANVRQQELNAAYRELLRAYRDGAAPIHDANPIDAGIIESGATTEYAPPRPGGGLEERSAPRGMASRRPSLVHTPFLLLVLSVLAALAGAALLIRGRTDAGAIPRGAVLAHAVAVGAGHGCTARSSAIFCWGHTYLGQTGGVRTARWVPVNIELPAAVQQLAAGLVHTCALLVSGEVHCWGGNFAGQLGDGSLDDRAAPAPALTDATIVEVSTLGNHVCGRADDGALYCWGNDMDGQLGTGSPVAACRWDDLRFFCAERPERVRAGSWKAVAAGGSHTCAVRDDGLVWCWGSNRHGQLGAPSVRSCAGPGGEQPCSRAPVHVRLGVAAEQVVAGATHACALDRSGQAFCWGSNHYGQTGTRASDDVASAAAVQGDLRFRSLAAGGYHTCGVTLAGELYCWGRNQYGELGTRARHRCDGVPCTLVPVRSRTSVTMVAAGFGVTCARRNDDTVSCWGRGEPVFAPAPRTVALPLHPGTRLRGIWAEIRWRVDSIRRFNLLT
jgi:alpha-tubulin suppressor-like RCC1 family protein